MAPGYQLLQGLSPRDGELLISVHHCEEVRGNLELDQDDDGLLALALLKHFDSHPRERATSVGELAQRFDCELPTLIDMLTALGQEGWVFP